MTHVSTSIVFGATIGAVWLRMGSDEALTLAGVLLIAGIALAVIRRKVKR